MFSSREHDPGRRQFLKGAAVAVGALAIGLGSRTGESGETLYDDSFIYNPDKLNIIPIREINQLYDFLQSSHWKGVVKKVKIVRDGEIQVDDMYGSHYGGKAANALYHPDQQEITVSNTVHVNMGTLWHELGHGVLNGIERLDMGNYRDVQAKTGLIQAFDRALQDALSSGEDRGLLKHSEIAKKILSGVSEDVGNELWPDFAETFNMVTDFQGKMVVKELRQRIKIQNPPELYLSVIENEIRLNHQLLIPGSLGRHFIWHVLQNRSNMGILECVDSRIQPFLIDKAKQFQTNVLNELFADYYMHHRTGNLASLSVAPQIKTTFRTLDD